MIRRVACVLVLFAIAAQAQQPSPGATSASSQTHAGDGTDTSMYSTGRLFLNHMTPNNKTASVNGSMIPPGGTAAPCVANTAVNVNTVTGGGRTVCNQWELVNNGWGRNVGSSPQHGQVSQWQVSSLFQGFVYSHTAGINEYWKSVFNGMNGGDKTMQRWWFNFLPGNTEDGSGEGAKGLYFYMHGMGDYVGKVNPGYTGTGLTYIQTTGSCNNQGIYSPTYCIGSPRPLIQPDKPIFTANARAKTDPTASTYGTLTLDLNSLAPTPHGTLANNIPDTTNYKDGSGFTTTYTAVAGTMPASGLMCVWGTNSPRLETLSYTLSGSTLTVTGGHRDPIVTLDAANAPIQAWAGACKGFISNPDAAVDGKKAMWWYLGNLTTNTIAWVAIDRNGPYSGGLGSSVSSFRAGVPGSNSISAYQVAEVIATYNQTAGYGSMADGSMELALNDMKWAPGATVEQVFTPSSRAMLMDLTCEPGTMSSNGLNACIALAMGHDTDAGLDLVLNNPIAETTAGGGLRSPIPQLFRIRSVRPTTLGAYSTLVYATIAPQTSLFRIGCQAADRTANCTRSSPYDLFDLQGANGGGHLTWHPSAGVLSLQGTLAVRSVQLTSASLPCTSAQKGQFNYIEGGPGVKDTVQVCAKDAADNYAWRTLY